MSSPRSNSGRPAGETRRRSTRLANWRRTGVCRRRRLVTCRGRVWIALTKTAVAVVLFGAAAAAF